MTEKKNNSPLTEFVGNLQEKMSKQVEISNAIDESVKRKDWREVLNQINKVISEKSTEGKIIKDILFSRYTGSYDNISPSELELAEIMGNSIFKLMYSTDILNEYLNYLTQLLNDQFKFARFSGSLTGNERSNFSFDFCLENSYFEDPMLRISLFPFSLTLTENYQVFNDNNQKINLYKRIVGDKDGFMLKFNDYMTDFNNNAISLLELFDIKDFSSEAQFAILNPLNSENVKHIDFEALGLELSEKILTFNSQSHKSSQNSGSLFSFMKKVEDEVPNVDTDEKIERLIKLQKSSTKLSDYNYYESINKIFYNITLLGYTESIYSDSNKGNLKFNDFCDKGLELLKGIHL